MFGRDGAGERVHANQAPARGVGGRVTEARGVERMDGGEMGSVRISAVVGVGGTGGVGSMDGLSCIAELAVDAFGGGRIVGGDPCRELTGVWRAETDGREALGDMGSATTSGSARTGTTVR